MKKYILLCLAAFVTVMTVYGQDSYSSRTSSEKKPDWLVKKMPKSKKKYYFDKGFGKGTTYEAAFENAMAQIKMKRSLATGQITEISSSDITSIKKTDDILTVKALVMDEYWEVVLDPDLKENVYCLYLLCKIPRNSK